MVVQGDLQFPCGGIAVGVETLPTALGSKAYVHLVTLGSVKVYGILDTVEYKCVFLRHLGRLCRVG